MWRIIDKKFTKVSWLALHEDQHGRPYYFIPKTKIIPFKTDTRFVLKKNYYIFHQDINKDLTIKNKARLLTVLNVFECFRPNISSCPSNARLYNNSASSNLP